MHNFAWIFSITILASVIIPLEVATSDHFVAHRSVHSDSLLTETQVRAKEGHKEVIANMIFNLHDLLQPHAKPDHQATGASAHRKKGAATPAKDRLPKAHDACNCVGVGNANHWAAQSMDTHPLVTEALADSIVKVIGSWTFIHALHPRCKCALLA